MKIAFISNFLNHHQLPFSLEMVKNNNIEYYFIATEKIPDERVKLGYENMNSKYEFVVETYKNILEKERALKIANESDVVIIGSASEEYIKQRLIDNKLTFRYSERIFKRGVWHLFRPRVFLYLLAHHTKYRNKDLFMLCASAYTAYDFSLVGAYKNKCLKWGYFPETKQYNIEELVKKKETNKPIQLLWVARFIDWKHPELVIKLTEYLKKRNYKFKIKMIGCGQLEERIKKLIKEKNLQNYIELMGSIPAREVRKHMEEANIFLATSDQNEGWGAVINEAMNSGCVVVGNKMIGAIPYLIQNEKNGLIYRNNKEFFKNVEELINDSKKRISMAIKSYYTIIDIWNAENASKRLIKICNELLNNKSIKIINGPCSMDNKEYKMLKGSK